MVSNDVTLNSSDGVDIGSVQQRDKDDNIYTPLSEAKFETIINASDLVKIDLDNDSVGLFKTSDFTETREITTNSAGLFEASDFTEDRNVRELQNETSVTSGTDSGGGSLPSNSVPDGKTVSVKALPSNTGQVQVDGNYPLDGDKGETISLQVDNTDKISYTTENGTEGVAFIVEG